MTQPIETQLLSNQRGSMTLHLTGGKEIGMFDGNDVGKNSPGHKRRASKNNRPIKTPRNRGARTFDKRALLAFCGQINTSRESSVREKKKEYIIRFIYFRRTHS